MKIPSTEEKTVLSTETKNELLDDMLDSLLTLGAVTVQKGKLERWLEGDWKKAAFWDVLQKKWIKHQEDNGEEGWHLYVGDGDGIFTLIILDVKIPEDNDSWWKSVAKKFEEMGQRAAKKGAKAAAKKAAKQSGVPAAAN